MPATQVVGIVDSKLNYCQRTEYYLLLHDGMAVMIFICQTSQQTHCIVPIDTA
jgi:hypothetical protein